MTADVLAARPEIVRWRRWSVGIAVPALMVCGIGGFCWPISFFGAYLAAYMFFLGVALGSMVLLLVYHLTGGSWGFLIRRILEAAMRTLPLMVVLFLPIAWGLKYIYPWARPELVAESAKLQYQQFYLLPTYFWIRAACYFAVWLAIGWLLVRWSRQEDATGDPRLAWKSQQLSGPAALLFGLSMHFAAVDWMMSVQPDYHSSIWGPLVVSGQLLSALAFALVVLALFIDRPPLNEVDSHQVRNDLGSLMLTLLILWAYMVFFQFMLSWIADLPMEMVWYLPRATAGWKAVMWAIFLLHFVTPFFLLLMRPIKRNSTAMAWVAGLLLVMQLLFDYYEVLAVLVGGEPQSFWLTIFTALGIGGLWLAYFLRQLQRAPLLPLHDYNRQHALKLHRSDQEEAALEEDVAYG